MCMTKKLNVWAVAVATVFAAAVLPREVSAQDASNGYRLWNFTSTIKGTALNCIGCHGQDPYNPPNAMLPGVNIATACNMAWPAGTAHALKTLCVIGEATATQAQAFSVVDGAINGQSLMSQFRTPLSPAERADLAAFLLASLKRTAVPFARPEFQQQGSTTPIGTLNFGSVNDGATSSQVVYFVNSGTLAMQIGPGFAAGASVSGLNQTRYTVTTVVPSGETACTASMQLPVGARCGLTVSFSPDLSVPQGALQTATLTIPSNGGSGVSQLNLNGARTVIAAPTLTLTPSATDLNAGTTAAGTSLNFAPITVRNNGTVALNIATITLGGANAADFTRATGGTNCADGGSVAPNAPASCNLPLRRRRAPPVPARRRSTSHPTPPRSRFASHCRALWVAPRR
jgi:mono/diheme cytochrome c family protein